MDSLEINELTEQMKNISFTLGTDIEFIILDNYNNLQPADNFFADEDGDATVGLDGCTTVLEVRPGYSNSPIGLVYNLKRCIDTIALRLHEGYKVITGSYVKSFPIGGHVHFGTQLTDIIKHNLSVTYGLWRCLFEEKQSCSKRLNQYGALNNFRTQPHGFEYRAPFSFAQSPAVALALLSLLSVAVTHGALSIRYPAVPELSIDTFNIKTRKLAEEYIKFFFKRNNLIPDNCKLGLYYLKNLVYQGGFINHINILETWATRLIVRKESA